ncbi:hypothetical protein HD554DRAFT_2041898 [Boletus coccyginus]|nr:hypothetical protein HD554DRAFT_2041898 [Boletus coccyginus]
MPFKLDPSGDLTMSIAAAYDTVFPVFHRPPQHFEALIAVMRTNAQLALVNVPHGESSKKIVFSPPASCSDGYLWLEGSIHTSCLEHEYERANRDTNARDVAAGLYIVVTVTMVQGIFALRKQKYHWYYCAYTGSSDSPRVAPVLWCSSARSSTISLSFRSLMLFLSGMGAWKVVQYTAEGDKRLGSKLRLLMNSPFTESWGERSSGTIRDIQAVPTRHSLRRPRAEYDAPLWLTEHWQGSADPSTWFNFCYHYAKAAGRKQNNRGIHGSTIYQCICNTTNRSHITTHAESRRPSLTGDRNK